MRTWSLQFAGALLFLTVGLLSIGVVRRARFATPTHAAAWRVTGIVFTIHGLNFTLQNLWGLAAMRAGMESGTMRAYLLAAPSFNHGRTFLLLAYCGVMFALALRPESVLPRLRWVTALSFCAGLAAGCALGVLEGRLVGNTHFAAVARWDAVELLLLLGMLFAALVRDAMDRLNWGLLALYAFSLSLNVVWFAALASIDSPSVWSPKPSDLHLVRLLLLMMMVAMTGWRYRLGVAGTRVAGLTGTARAPVTLHAGAGWMG